MVGLRDDRWCCAGRRDRDLRPRLGIRHPARHASLPMKRLLVLLVLLWSAIAGAVPLEHLPSHGRIETSYEPGLEPTARQLEGEAEDALADIATDLVDLPTPRVIHLQVVRDASSLAEVAPEGRGAPQYAIGVAYPDLGVISIATRKGGQLVDPT